MALKFGTDGMRGDARSELTAQAVEALGRAGAEVLGGTDFAVGRDTRQSGPELVSAIHRGVLVAGGSPVDLGVLPTPAVARWCADEVVAGAMVSASHNPWHDNGVKFFAPGGTKLDDAVQEEIQSRFDELFGAGPYAAASSANASDTLGREPPVRQAGAHAAERHIDAVVSSILGRDLSGLSVVIDAANGAASVSGPEGIRRLGATVHVLHADPNGLNINDGCGSTHPESLQEAVVALGADAGLAFDGDADRLLAVDHSGALIDGDQMIAICAIDRHQRAALLGSAVVVTVMANLGFRRAMAAEGIRIVDTAVGDRYVLEALDEHGLVLGGEQSGHLIFRDIATTGDGLLTAVQLLDVVKRSGHPLAELAESAMTRLPQVLQGVRLDSRPSDLDEVIGPIVAAGEARLGDRGRVLVRPSGTEPLVRIMVEADDDATASSEADRLSAEIAEALNLEVQQ